MGFKMKYDIKTDYIRKGTRRPGTYISPNFGVLHDTGNYGSTAQNNRDYYNNTPNDPSYASAQTFIDDEVILEVIPATTGKTERAYHVIYDVTTDNALFGDDANDKAIGVELCFGENKKTGRKIDFEEAYKRYVWYCAYVSYKFGFSPERWVGHEKLDPKRKTDPSNALNRYGKTYEQLRKDIVKEYSECTVAEVESPKPEVKESAPAPERQLLEVLVDSLHTYGSPNWNDKSGPIVNKGEVFTVLRSLNVAGAKMYQLKSGLYITASTKYVKVRKG